MKNKKKVPQKWYKEWANELARGCMNAWLKFGHDSEQRKEAQKELDDFRAKYNPVKQLSGNLPAAKLEIKLNEGKIRQSVGIKDKYDPYNFMTLTAEKYFLCDAQTRKLIDFAGKMGLCY